MADITDKIDRLLEKQAYLIDLFPKTVPAKQDGRYFEIDEYFRRNRQDTDRKFETVLLKLYCYYDFTVHTADQTAVNPAPAHLLAMTDHCLKNRQPGENMYILIPETESMIMLNGDDLYMVMYHPDQELKSLTAQLAASEGLFFYEAP